MTLLEFLIARLDDEERIWGSNYIMRGEIRFKRKIIEAHQAWPVLLETRPSFNIVEQRPESKNATTTILMEMQTKYQWMLADEYRKAFGTEPPSAPILKEMAKLYSDHPDYNPDWS